MHMTILRLLKNAYTILGISLLVLEYLAKKKSEKQESVNKDPNEVQENWDSVDEASWESFPASDPPSTY